MKYECELIIDCGIISGESRDKLINFGINEDYFVQRKSYDEYYFRPDTLTIDMELSIQDLNELSKIGKVVFYEDYFVYLEIE